jgi:hypothetical protein
MPKEKLQHQVGLPLVEDFLENSVKHVSDVIACHNLHKFRDLRHWTD